MTIQKGSEDQRRPEPEHRLQHTGDARSKSQATKSREGMLGGSSLLVLWDRQYWGRCEDEPNDQWCSQQGCTQDYGYSQVYERQTGCAGFELDAGLGVVVLVYV